jgi:hypothetical protein
VASAWATVATEALLFAAGLGLLSRYLGGLPWVRPLLPVAVSGAAMAAVAWPLRDAFPLVPVVVSSAVYVVTAMASGALPAPEVTAARAVLATRLGRRWPG